MSLRPDDLVLVHVKAPTGDHKIVDWWEATPHHVLSQLAEQLVFKVQPVDAEDDENIWVLHRNMLFPLNHGCFSFCFVFLYLTQGQYSY